MPACAPDLMQSAGGAPATTAGMGDAILAALEDGR
jgi:hypothetical protein